MTRTAIPTEEVAAIFKKEFGDGISDIEVREWCEGSKKTPIHTLWMHIDRSLLLKAVSCLIEIDYPHLGVISGCDTGDDIDLVYNMMIFFGIRGREINVTFVVTLPKSDLSVPTISGLIPGAVYTEREKIEMLGIDVTDIPDRRGLFLPADFPKGVYPWRKDETGIQEGHVKELWAVGRPENRPAPPVKPKEKKEADPVEARTPEKDVPAPEEVKKDE